MRKRIIQIVLVLAIFVGFVACTENVNDPINDSTIETTTTNESHTETGMYLAIITFSENVDYCPFGYGYVSGDSWCYERYNLLNSVTINDYKKFINSANMGRATLLYYAVDTTLSYLEKCKFPDDVKSVSVITFTDGLDQGSHAFNNKYNGNNEAYMEAINHKINNINVNGVPIEAYTIGVRGNDVTGDVVEAFQNNLRQLSSPEQEGKKYAMEVANIDDVNAKFKEIAESLYQRTESRSLSITIPMPAANTYERFTFDNVTDATESNLYLEGVYTGGVLKDIQYKGCSSTSGNVVSAIQNGVMLTFEFENFMDAAGNSIGIKGMQQWYKSETQSTWTRNSEFKPDEAIKTKEDRQSAVVTLILDCSSSLGSDFVKVQKAACDFIQALAGEISNNGGDDNNDSGDDKPVTTSQVRFCKAEPYIYWYALGLGAPNSSEVFTYHTFGTDAGISPYYEISAGIYEPLALYYDEADEESMSWYYSLPDSPYTYYFEAGKKYTYTLTDDGEYVYGTINWDSSINAPAQVVKQWKCRKSAMVKVHKNK